jgi:amino acid transporter
MDFSLRLMFGKDFNDFITRATFVLILVSIVVISFFLFSLYDVYTYYYALPIPFDTPDSYELNYSQEDLGKKLIGPLVLSISLLAVLAFITFLGYQINKDYKQRIKKKLDLIKPDPIG